MWTVIVGLVAVVGFMATLGADSLWLAALGDAVAHSRSVPVGIPFAAAPSTHWANVPVLAELVFHALEALAGDKGLLIAHLTAVGAALTVLARRALSEGATAGAVGLGLLVIAVGGAEGLIVIRAQLFSVALFPVLIAVLRSEARKPSRRIWLIVPLVALWANLHGAVLVGLGVALVYLILCRARTELVTAGAVSLFATAALFATPALASTARYYAGVSANRAAARGNGLWAPLSLHSPFDLLLVLAAAALLAAFVRMRPQLWEAVAVAALGALTVHASRFGIWLLFFLFVPAVQAIAVRSPKLRLCSVIVSTALTVLAVAAGPARVSAGPALLERTAAVAGGRAVLAEPALAERLALARGRVWIGDPIDAFSPADQEEYLDWVGGTSGRALRHIDVVLVSRGSPAERLVRRSGTFIRLAADDRAALYRRTRRVG